MRARYVLMISLLALVAAACGGDADPGAGGTTSPTDVATTPAEDPITTGEATIAVSSSDLGEILVDGDGMTLYLFTPDEQGEPTCTDSCAATWPPFEGPATAGAGADASLIDSTAHASGVTQVTYNGWPLYFYAGDSAAGDTNGQGLGGNWFVVSASGEAIEG